MLDWTAKKFPHFAQALHYTLVEGSLELARRLRERFADRIGCGKVEVLISFDDFRGQYDNAIVFANEFFDALPVEIVSTFGQVYVGAEQGRFVEVSRPPTPDVDEFLDRYGVRPEAGDRVEACTAALPWMKTKAIHARYGLKDPTRIATVNTVRRLSCSKLIL